MSNKVICLGDVHGDAYDAEYRLEALCETGQVNSGDVILWLGDVGIIYGRFSNMLLMHKMEEFGKIHDVTNLVLRGNHDTRYCRDLSNGHFLDVISGLTRSSYTQWMLGNISVKFQFGGNVMYTSEFPHVGFLPDEGGSFDFFGTKTLVIPGAYSVDKWYRLRNDWSWEPEEQLTQAEMKNLFKICDFTYDAIVSHTCPLSWQMDFRDLLLSNIPNIDNIMEKWMEKVYQAVEPDEWWFGHYHADRDLSNGVGHMLYNDWGILGDGGVRPMPFLY